MSDTQPAISVVVLTRNRLRLLRGGLRSLQQQRYPRDRVELVVVNDGSRDGTRDWLDAVAREDSRVRPVHQEPRGIPAARNAGIRAARGDLIAIVADDYLFEPDYLATIAGFFHEHPEARIVRFGIAPADRWPGSLLSHFYYEVSFRKRLHPEAQPASGTRREKLRAYFRRLPEVPDRVTSRHQLEAAGAAGFRREVFEEVGLFDESLLRAEDTDMAIRLRAAGIPIFYNPFHKIRHRYGHWGADTFRKCFASGRYAARLHRKHGTGGATGRRPGLANRALLVIWRVRQAAGPLRGLLLLPGLVAFEAAWQAGYWLGCFRERGPEEAG